MANAARAVQTVSEGWLGVPWIIWSGILSAAVGAGIAAFTVWASGKNSVALLRRQHINDSRKARVQRAHDAKQKDEDRKGLIRREVYSKAVEETHALLGFIGGLPERLIDPSKDGEALQNFLKANAKIWLVADAEAAHLSRDLASEFAEAVLNQLKASYPYRRGMDLVRRLQEDIEFAEAEARRIDSELTNAKVRRESVEEQRRLEELATEARNRAKSLEMEKQQALSERAPRRMEIFTASFGQLGTVQRALVKLVSALRAELNLPRDEEEFMEQLKDAERRAWAAVNRAYGIDPAPPMPLLVHKSEVV